MLSFMVCVFFLQWIYPCAMPTQDGYVSICLSDRIHRIVEFLCLGGTSKGHLVQAHLAQEGPVEAGCAGPCLDGIWIFQRWRPQPPRAICPHIQREPAVFQVVSVVTDSVSGHHWREPGSILLTLQVFLHTAEIPLSFLFSRLDSPRSLGLASYVRYSGLFSICVILS